MKFIHAKFFLIGTIASLSLLLFSFEPLSSPLQIGYDAPELRLLRASTSAEAQFPEHLNAWDEVPITTLGYRKASLVDPASAADVRVSSNDPISLVEGYASQPEGTQSLSLDHFIASVSDGHSQAVRGVYVEGVLALPVVQQPQGDPAFVSDQDGVITQFGYAAAGGVVGLLAHNFLSGERFFELVPGQEVVIVHGDGSLSRYLIELISQFERLSPNSFQSNFVDLGTGETLTSSQIFQRFYSGGNFVTFQTCLEKNGTLNWGVQFIVANPVRVD